MNVVTVEMIRSLDRQATEQGMPSRLLMENAGRAVVDLIVRQYGDKSSIRGMRVVVACGHGNNGGDGFVIARLLTLAGASVAVFVSGDRNRLSADASLFYDLMLRSGITTKSLSDLSASLVQSQPDLIVDALLGTGVQSAPKPPFDEAIRAVNSSRAPVVSVDIPSGVDANGGKTPGEAVMASQTLTFAFPKLGAVTFPGATNAGKLHVAEIGFDWRTLTPPTEFRLLHYVTNTVSRGVSVADAGQSVYRGDPIAHGLLRPRDPDSNKGDFGHVGVVAGSRGMCGAPAMVARAAQRAGSGLVTVLTPASVQPVIAAKLDEQMTIGLAERDGSLSEDAFEAIREFASRAAVLCIGPGLTTAPGTAGLVRRLLTELEMPIVLDADGLNALAMEPDIVNARTESTATTLILTPHPGEAARLLGTSIASVQSNRIEAVREVARRYRAVTVLKGGYSLVADPDGNVLINMSGNPGMATGGMGDALTGIVGAMIARAVAPARKSTGIGTWQAPIASPLEAVGLGVHLHGLAGDLAALEFGEAGLIAGDVIDRIPAAIRMIEGV